MSDKEILMFDILAKTLFSSSYHPIIMGGRLKRFYLCMSRIQISVSDSFLLAL